MESFSGLLLDRLGDDSRAGFGGQPPEYMGQAEDPVQDTWIALGAKIESGLIERVCYEVYGCPYTMAALAQAAKELEGQPVAQLGAIDVRRLAAQLRVPTERLGRLLLIQDAAASCLRAWQARDARHNS